jgi:hypothetical protein
MGDVDFGIAGSMDEKLGGRWEMGVRKEIIP